MWSSERRWRPRFCTKEGTGGSKPAAGGSPTPHRPQNWEGTLRSGKSFHGSRENLAGPDSRTNYKEPTSPESVALIGHQHTRVCDSNPSMGVAEHRAGAGYLIRISTFTHFKYEYALVQVVFLIQTTACENMVCLSSTALSLHITCQRRPFPPGAGRALPAAPGEPGPSSC